MLHSFAKLIRDGGRVLAEAAKHFFDDGCLRLGAALSYYAVFSIFPLLLLSVSAVGFILGSSDEVRERAVQAFASTISPAQRDLLDQTLRSMQEHRTERGLGALVGVVGLMLGASAVFAELEASFDTIWHVKPSSGETAWQTVLSTVKSRAIAFAIVAATAIVLLASLVASAAVGGFARAALGGHALSAHLVEMCASLFVHAALFATLFRVVPHAPVKWRDVVFGSVVAALAFAGLKAAYAWYLAGVGGYAAYGVVGVVLGLLTWIYAVGLVLFYGAEVSHAYATTFGSLSASSDETNRRSGHTYEGRWKARSASSS
jgi:membrane protein